MTLVVFAASCGTNQSPNSEEGKNSNQNAQTVSHKETEVVDNQSQKKESKYMYELAINQSKEGQHQNFLDTRAKFVEVLGNQEETLNEGKWNPFFTVAPDLNLDNILIGMTHWNSMEGFGQTAARLLPQQEAVDYFASFNPLAYALLETVDGEPFDLESIKKEGNVVEFAVRKGKSNDAFGEK
ncbi:MAG: hypothetical protein HRT74_04130 [Flavobacteriales bacterium]|nr:hypothetical protein [Flavobacteriales bacterium]